MYIQKAIFALTLTIFAVPALAESPPLDKNDPNALRCKRLSETGSLVKKRRVCKTNAEWRAIAEQQGRDADDLITRSRTGMNRSN